MLHEAMKAFAGGFAESLNLAVAVLGGIFMAIKQAIERGARQDDLRKP